MGWLYLILLVMCASGLNLSCKWGSRKGSSPLGLATVVQVVSFPVVLGVSLAHGGAYSTGIILLGAGAGVGGAVGFLLNVQALRIGHYAFTTCVVSASFLVSVLFSVFVWEQVSGVQIAGIAVLTAAVLLISLAHASGRDRGSGHWGKWAARVGGSFLLLGLAQICYAAFVRKFAPGGAPLLGFMTVIYAVGAAVLLPINLRRGEMHRGTVLYGSLGAGASLLGTVFNLEALGHLPPSVVFPVAVSGALLVAALLSRLLFKEKIRPLGYVGIATEIAGVVLLAQAMVMRHGASGSSGP